MQLGRHAFVQDPHDFQSIVVNLEVHNVPLYTPPVHAWPPS
jgi:hypothetical protein